MPPPTDPQALAEACAAAMWAEDTASQGLGMQLEAVGPGTARMAMPVRDGMVNGHGMCHGGFIFTLADSAFAFACNSRNAKCVAAGGSINVLRPARLGDTLTATAGNDLNTQLDLERDLQGMASRTEDHKEGVTAFLEKRPAQFKGR